MAPDPSACVAGGGVLEGRVVVRSGGGRGDMYQFVARQEPSNYFLPRTKNPTLETPEDM